MLGLRGAEGAQLAALGRFALEPRPLVPDIILSEGHIRKPDTHFLDLTNKPDGDSISKVFISYSHDSDVQMDWVSTLATRLIANGVDVVLDQCDLTLGSDLPLFAVPDRDGADGRRPNS